MRAGAGKSQELGGLRMSWFSVFWNRMGSGAERLDVANQLPALGFGEFGPYGHTTADHTIGQQPEKGAGRGILHFIGAQARTLLPALGHVSVALGTVLSEEFAAGCRSIGIGF